jgi:hypothetical protein
MVVGWQARHANALVCWLWATHYKPNLYSTHIHANCVGNCATFSYNIRQWQLMHVHSVISVFDTDNRCTLISRSAGSKSNVLDLGESIVKLKAVIAHSCFFSSSWWDLGESIVKLRFFWNEQMPAIKNAYLETILDVYHYLHVRKIQKICHNRHNAPKFPSRNFVDIRINIS